MRPEVRFHSTIVVLTIAVMYILITRFAQQVDTSPQNQSLWLWLLLSAASSLGFYRALTIVIGWVIEHSEVAMRLVMGPYFVRGTWIGILWTKTRKPRVVVEHYDQTLASLSVRGQSFKPDGELNAAWYTHSAQIQPEKGLIHCFYGVNVPRKLYEVEGIGVLQFDRPSSGGGPRAMTGYGLDTDAGMELEKWKSEGGMAEGFSGKLIFEEYRKISGKLLPMDEAKQRALEAYGARAAEPPASTGRSAAPPAR
jgi:hypothetical protein